MTAEEIKAALKKAADYLKLLPAKFAELREKIDELTHSNAEVQALKDQVTDLQNEHEDVSSSVTDLVKAVDDSDAVDDFPSTPPVEPPAEPTDVTDNVDHTLDHGTVGNTDNQPEPTVPAAGAPE